MNVIPTEDPSVLEVFRSNACEDECAGALAEGDVVASGTPLTLVYAGTSLPDTHTTFVSSSGLLAGGESCGDEGASLLCSSCGEGWLKRATWTPTSTGVAQIAVGFAHGNYGTPAVTVGILTVNVAEANVTDAPADGARARGLAPPPPAECGSISCHVDLLATELCQRYKRLIDSLLP
eukprot:958910-Prymnesium_polylepis.1